MNFDDINLIYIAMPPSIRAAVTVNEDDSYTIFVNKNLSAETQRKATIHEIRHTIRGDLYDDAPADDKEVSIREETK